MIADHKERQSVHIGRAAVDLAVTKGLSGVSMSALAQAAGVARATLYNYFPDVQTAIRAYLTASTNAFYDHVSATVAAEPTPAGKLRCYVLEQIGYVAGDEHRAAAQLMENGALPPPPAATRREDRHLGLLIDVLTEGITAAAFRSDLEVAVTAGLIQRMLYATHDLLHNQHVDGAVVIAEVLAFVEGRVLAAPTPSSR